MKTIDEAAKEAVKNKVKNTDSECNIQRSVWYETGFKEGAEFAQRWIHVEEELPKKQGHYFVKVLNSFPKNCNVVVAEFYEDNNNFYSESSDYPIHDAIAWRPIELK